MNWKILLLSIAATLLVLSPWAKADNPVNWSFDVTTDGSDASWDSGLVTIDSCRAHGLGMVPK